MTRYFDDPSSLGAYGLTLPVADSSWFLGPAAVDWPVVEIVRQVDDAVQATRSELNADHALLSFGDEGSVRITERDRRAVFTMGRPLSDAELVHPYLAPIGATFAWWSGREALHAGAFAIGDRVWAVMGDKGAGKSSLLASLALLGHDVISDDMVVVDGEMALSGPRCIDLRESAAAHLGAGEAALRGSEVRWRLRLEPVAPVHRFCGWVILRWGETLETARIPGSARLECLRPHRSMLVEPRDPVSLLELAALPAWELTRSPGWEALPQTVERLLALVD